MSVTPVQPSRKESLAQSTAEMADSESSHPPPSDPFHSATLTPLRNNEAQVSSDEELARRFPRQEQPPRKLSHLLPLSTTAGFSLPRGEGTLGLTLQSHPLHFPVLLTLCSTCSKCSFSLPFDPLHLCISYLSL